MSMMSKVSQYFCVFCSFKCDEYKNAFYHYRSHMFIKDNCECCDYSHVYIYVADSSDLDNQCGHSIQQSRDEIKYKPIIIDRWISTFLAYQTKLLDTTYANLLSRNKVCVVCAVCRYLVENYRKNGGDMNQVQYISNEDRLEHCYAHLRYDPRSIETRYKHIKHSQCRINDYDKYEIHQKIRKLDAIIEHWCDSFFTGDLNDEYKLAANEESDSNFVSPSVDCTEQRPLTPRTKERLTVETLLEMRFNRNEVTEQSPQTSRSEQRFAAKMMEALNVQTNEIEGKSFNEDSDGNSVNDIVTNKSLHCSSQSSLNQYTFASTSVEDIELLAPIFAKLSVIESNVDKLNQKLMNIESKHSKCGSDTTGNITYFADTTAPNGWLKANGQTVSRTTYANLFATIGTQYGCGDDSTTFTLPDLAAMLHPNPHRSQLISDDDEKKHVYASFQVASILPSSCGTHYTSAADQAFNNNVAFGTRDGISSEINSIPTPNKSFIKSSCGKLPTSSMDKPLSSILSERGSPISFQIEWFHSESCICSDVSNANNRVAKPGDARSIVIEKYSALSSPFGIQIHSNRKEKGAIFVSEVSSNSIASRIGLLVGDQLLEVCGINMRNATHLLAANVLNDMRNADNITMLVHYNPDKYNEQCVKVEESDEGDDEDDDEQCEEENIRGLAISSLTRSKAARRSDSNASRNAEKTITDSINKTQSMSSFRQSTACEPRREINCIPTPNKSFITTCDLMRRTPHKNMDLLAFIKY